AFMSQLPPPLARALRAPLQPRGGSDPPRGRCLWAARQVSPSNAGRVCLKPRAVVVDVAARIAVIGLHGKRRRGPNKYCDGRDGGCNCSNHFTFPSLDRTIRSLKLHWAHVI